MLNIKKLTSSFLLLLMGAACFVSCDDDDHLGSPDRLFRPVIQSTLVTGTTIQVEWDRYKGALEFELDLSVDSFKSINRTVITELTQYTFENLDYDTKYMVRLRSLGENGISSAYFLNKEVQTQDYPTKLINPSSSDLIDTDVRVSWALSEEVYTQLEVWKSNELIATHELTQADNEAGNVIVRGLSATTTYTIRIYSGEQYMGKKTYRTTAAEQYQGDVVDLRSFDEESSLDILTQSLVDSLAIDHPNGFTLVLAGGVRYKIPTLVIPVELNMVTGLSLAGNAIAHVNGGFGIPASTTVEKISFDKIMFTEGTDAGKLKTDGNFGGTYLFNFNTANGVLNKLDVTNCDIRYKRGFVRLQTAGAALHAFNMNNCFVDSIGGYGIMNNDNNGSIVGDVIIKNSTIGHCEVFLVGSKAPFNSVVVENVTGCYIPGGSTRYLFDFGSLLIPGGITMKASLFGKPQSGETAHGMRAAAGTNITIENCFRASDYGWTLNATTSLPSAPITDLEDFGSTTNAIFANPANLDFKVTSSRLVGRIGDPRWW